jgi:hypothetical protein
MLRRVEEVCRATSLATLGEVDVLGDARFTDLAAVISATRMKSEEE